jgi:serine/threonine-protein kinase
MKLCPLCNTGFHDSHTTCPTHGGMLSEIRDLKAGMLIRNTYRIVRKLGEGGFGSVYLADQTLMDEPRALKFLSYEMSRDESFTARFRREAQSLRQVRHKNVVDSGDLERAEDDTLFFAMEYVDGPDLGHFLDSAPRPFDVRLALDLAHGIAEGLGAAHSKGLVHRDIKPDNILLASGPGGLVAKIADFGIVATKETSKTYRKTGGTLLTPPYAAPEQWRGTPAAQLDGRTDLYALGGVLFEMLTGETVFDAENYEGWAWEHANTPPRPPSQLRPELANWRGLDALVLRLLAKNRDDRPSNVTEVLSLLSAIGYVEPAPSAVPKPRRPTEVEQIRPVETRAALEEVPEPGPVLRSVFPEQPEPLPLKKPVRHNKLHTAIVAAFLVVAVAPVVVVSLIHRFAADANALETTTDSSPQPSNASQPQQDPATAGQPASNSQTPAPAQPDRSTSVPSAANFAGMAKQANALFSQQNYAQAKPLFEQACTGGSGDACNGLGIMYLTGFGATFDNAQAFDLFNKACRRGSAEGCGRLGSMYINGWGTAEDDARGVGLMTQSCDTGNEYGCAQLAILYAAGTKGLAQDLEKSAQLFAKACKQGNEYACKQSNKPQ